jgi:hypothetical protein
MTFVKIENMRLIQELYDERDRVAQLEKELRFLKDMISKNPDSLIRTLE